MTLLCPSKWCFRPPSFFQANVPFETRPQHEEAPVPQDDQPVVVMPLPPIQDVIPSRYVTCCQNCAITSKTTDLFVLLHRQKALGTVFIISNQRQSKTPPLTFLTQGIANFRPEQRNASSITPAGTFPQVTLILSVTTPDSGQCFSPVRIAIIFVLAFASTVDCP